MTPNHVKQLRCALGHSQGALAAQLGIPQPQLARIECGAEVLRYELALRLVEALESSFEKVFPRAKRVSLLIAQEEQDNHAHLPPPGSAAEVKFDHAGIDTDLNYHCLRVYLRGGPEFEFPVTAHASHHVGQALRHDRGAPAFVVFDSQAQRIILNLQHALLVQHLQAVTAPPEQVALPHRPPGAAIAPSLESASAVSVYLEDAPGPLIFYVDDEPAVDGLEDPDPDDVLRPLTRVSIDAETFDPHVDHSFVLKGQAAELIYIEPRAMMLLCIPLRAFGLEAD